MLIETIRIHLDPLEADLANTEKEAERLLCLQDIGMGNHYRARLTAVKKRQDDISKQLVIEKSAINNPTLVKASKKDIHQLMDKDYDYASDITAVNDMIKKLRDDSFRRRLLEPLSLIVNKVVCDFNRGHFHVLLTTGFLNLRIFTWGTEISAIGIIAEFPAIFLAASLACPANSLESSILDCCRFVAAFCRPRASARFLAACSNWAGGFYPPPLLTASCHGFLSAFPPLAPLPVVF